MFLSVASIEYIKHLNYKKDNHFAVFHYTSRRVIKIVVHNSTFLLSEVTLIAVNVSVQFTTDNHYVPIYSKMVPDSIQITAPTTNLKL